MGDRPINGGGYPRFQQHTDPRPQIPAARGPQKNQKWYKSDPQMIPKWPQSATQIMRKWYQMLRWSQNDTKLMPNAKTKSQNDRSQIPKWSRNYSRMIPKWSQNARMIPKWSQSGPDDHEMTPKPNWSQNDNKWPQRNSKMIPGECQVQTMITKWPITDPKVISKWSRNDAKFKNDPKLNTNRSQKKWHKAPSVQLSTKTTQEVDKNSTRGKANQPPAHAQRMRQGHWNRAQSV